MGTYALWCTFKKLFGSKRVKPWWYISYTAG